MRILQVLAYSAAFALAYAWVLVWVLERRDKKYRQGDAAFSDTFLAGSITLVLTFLSNVLVLLAWPLSAATYNVGLVTALAGFCLYRESLYKLEAKKIEHRRRAELRLLRIYIARDPANAAYFTRLSVLHERLGEKKDALEAALMAEKLEPTERNRWRIKQLRED